MAKQLKQCLDMIVEINEIQFLAKCCEWWGRLDVDMKTVQFVSRRSFKFSKFDEVIAVAATPDLDYIDPCCLTH